MPALGEFSEGFNKNIAVARVHPFNAPYVAEVNGSVLSVGTTRKGTSSGMEKRKRDAIEPVGRPKKAARLTHLEATPEAMAEAISESMAADEAKKRAEKARDECIRQADDRTQKIAKQIQHTTELANDLHFTYQNSDWNDLNVALHSESFDSDVVEAAVERWSEGAIEAIAGQVFVADAKREQSFEKFMEADMESPCDFSLNQWKEEKKARGTYRAPDLQTGNPARPVVNLKDSSPALSLTSGGQIRNLLAPSATEKPTRIMQLAAETARTVGQIDPTRQREPVKSRRTMGPALILPVPTSKVPKVRIASTITVADPVRSEVPQISSSTQRGIQSTQRSTRVPSDEDVAAASTKICAELREEISLHFVQIHQYVKTTLDKAIRGFICTLPGSQHGTEDQYEHGVAQYFVAKQKEFQTKWHKKHAASTFRPTQSNPLLRTFAYLIAELILAYPVQEGVPAGAREQHVVALQRSAMRKQKGLLQSWTRYFEDAAHRARLTSHGERQGSAVTHTAQPPTTGPTPARFSSGTKRKFSGDVQFAVAESGRPMKKARRPSTNFHSTLLKKLATTKSPSNEEAPAARSSQPRDLSQQPTQASTSRPKKTACDTQDIWKMANCAALGGEEQWHLHRSHCTQVALPKLQELALKYVTRLYDDPKYSLERLQAKAAEMVETEFRLFTKKWIQDHQEHPYAEKALLKQDDFMGDQLACFIAQVAVKQLRPQADINKHVAEIQKRGMALQMAYLQQYAEHFEGNSKSSQR